METEVYIWMFIVLKIPILAALVLIWWAIKEPEAKPEEDDGGTRRPAHPHGPRPPRPPRRGPHAGEPVAPPPRVRTGAAGPGVRSAR